MNMPILNAEIDSLKTTGWRNVDLAPLAAITSGALFLKRKGDRVLVQANWIATTGSPALAALIPAGFVPDVSGGQPLTFMGTDGVLAVQVSINAAGDVALAYLGGDVAPGSSHIHFAIEYTTAADFPATPYPGVAFP